MRPDTAHMRRLSKPRVRAVGVPAVLVMALTVLTGCSSGSTDSRDCVSHYEPVAEAATLGQLKQTLRDDVSPRVASLLVIDDHPEEGKKYVNLLNNKRRLVASLDFWQRDDGTWTAQQWSQCID